MTTLVTECLYNLDIDESDLRVEDLLVSPFIYEQQLIKFLVSSSICQTSPNINTTMALCGKNVLKIEGLEKLSHKLYSVCQKLATTLRHHGPVTCHMFHSPQDAQSFPMHTDPDDVYLYVVSGVKNMIIGDVEHVIGKGQGVLIPRDTPHQAINRQASCMLSFGLERFLEDKL